MSKNRALLHELWALHDQLLREASRASGDYSRSYTEGLCAAARFLVERITALYSEGRDL